MAKAQDRFTLTRELGDRLRAIRLRRGLTQQQCAELMGRTGRHGHALIGNLELARVGNPTLGVVLDFLRACRAPVSEVSDILERYVARPTVVERQGSKLVKEFTARLPVKTARVVEHYDIDSTVQRRYTNPVPEQPDKRLDKVRHMAAAWIQRQELENRLHRLLNEFGLAGGDCRRKALCDYGRKVWGIMNRARKRPARRQARLDEARDWLIAEGVVPAEPVRMVERAVTSLHRALEESGELDRLPSAEQAHRLALLSPGDRVTRDEKLCREEWRKNVLAYNTTRMDFIERLWKGQMLGLVEQAGVAAQQRVGYLSSLGQLWHISTKQARDRKHYDELVREYLALPVARRLEHELFLRLADLFYRAFEQARPNLPPDPWQDSP